MSEVLFVGREQEIDVYHQFLALETPWVLIITGLGGIGKSTLLHRLAEYTLETPTLSSTSVVMIDFADEDLRNDPLKLLGRLTQDTLPACKVQQADVELKKAVQQNFDQLAQLRKERVQTGFSETEDPALREIRHQMRELATEALYIQLKSLCALRLVIMLDTCEWLMEPEGVEVGQWILNELIPGIHTRIKQQKQQCSVIMVSRVQLNLEAINGREQRRLALPMLDKEAVDRYLQHVGMKDPELRERVYDVTHGHALVVSIIGDFWKNREEQTQPFTLADMPELQIEEFSEIALMRFTNERVLKQLRSPFLELTQFGILLRSFNLPFLRAVFPEMLPEDEAPDRFNQLIRYPFIESRGNYRYAFHELLREALAEGTQKEAPEQWKHYHKRALDYLTETAPQSPDWYYHLLAYDEAQGLAAWQEALQDARSIGKREYIGALLQAALDPALQLSPATRAEIAYEQGRFNYYGVQWDEALKSYNESLTSFEEVGDFAGQAKTLQSIGDVQRTRGKPDEALASYKKALTLYRQVGDMLGEARCCQAMGDVRRLHNELEAALEYYKQCLDLFRQIKEKTEEAKALEAVGDIQALRNNLDAALHSYEQALALYQGEQDRLKRARILKAMGDIQRRREDPDSALESYGQALAIFGELKEPSEEAAVRRAIEEMQKPVTEQGKLQQDHKQLNDQAPTYLQIPTSNQHPSHRKGYSKRKIFLLLVLVLLILSGSGYAIYANILYYAQSHARTLLDATLTSQANLTASANISASIPPNPPKNANLALVDPLTKNSQYSWQVDSDIDGGSCQFISESYHVLQNHKVGGTGAQTSLHICTAHKTFFSNFEFEIEMEIKSGDNGGIIFRINSASSEFYFLNFNQSGTYTFELVTGNESRTLGTGLIPEFNTGDQTNLIAVIVQNNRFYLFINQTFITLMLDSSLKSGQIGVAAESKLNDTEVIFTNARVWSI